MTYCKKCDKEIPNGAKFCVFCGSKIQPSYIRGGAGEPYCSEKCFEEGGRHLSIVMMKSQNGYCYFCKKPVKASLYGAIGCSVIPYEGSTLFFCIDPDCINKAKLHLTEYRRCCMCQKDLDREEAKSQDTKQVTSAPLKDELKTVFNALWTDDLEERNRLCDRFWVMLWQLAKNDDSSTPGVRKISNASGNPQQVLKVLSENIPFDMPNQLKIELLKTVMESLVEQYILNGQKVGPGHSERLRMILDHKFDIRS